MNYQTGNFIHDGQLCYGSFIIYGNLECATYEEAFKLCEERDFYYVVSDLDGNTVKKVWFCGYCGQPLNDEGDCYNSDCEAGG